MSDNKLFQIEDKLSGIFDQLEIIAKALTKLVEINTTKRQFQDWLDSEGLTQI